MKEQQQGTGTCYHEYVAFPDAEYEAEVNVALEEAIDRASEYVTDHLSTHKAEGDFAVVVSEIIAIASLTVATRKSMPDHDDCVGCWNNVTAMLSEISGELSAITNAAQRRIDKETEIAFRDYSQQRDEPLESPVSEDKANWIHAWYHSRGIDPHDCLVDVSKMIGREIGSVSDITAGEAETVISSLVSMSEYK